MTSADLRLELLRLVMSKAPQDPDLVRVMAKVRSLETFVLGGYAEPAPPIKRGPGRPRKHDPAATTDTPRGPV